MYRALDPDLGRAVALKILEGPPPGESCLADEARLLATLSHPSLATVYELGHEGGVTFMAMELVEGEPLSALVAQGPLDLERAVGLLVDLAGALGRVHEGGIRHGDVKPDNVIVTPEGRAKLVDFGFSAALTAAPIPPGPAGSLPYLSPEQARGEPADARSDVFSLGVVAFEAVSGRRPFDGNRPDEILRSLLEDEPRLLGSLRGDIPLRLEAVIRRALAKDRRDRYSTADELRRDLERVRGALGRSPSASAVPEPEAPSPAFRGLDSFQESDRARFFGRDDETSALLDWVTHEDYRFGVLYGDSGSGKTSLLRAGLIPSLRERDWLPIYFRGFADPLSQLLLACERETSLGREPDELPADYLARLSRRLGTRVLLVLDQLEELFVRSPAGNELRAFTDCLAACYARPDLPVAWLMAVRSDFLHHVAEHLDDVVPEPLLRGRRFRLEALRAPQAETIIERSARRAGLPLEAGLAHSLATDLATGGLVLPSELQIVGEQLQRRRLFSYQAYRRSGGRESLVRDHLEEVIESTGDDEGARRLLRCLISDESTKETLSVGEISPRAHRPPAEVERLLGVFVQARLVRELQEGRPWRYELVHEYLIDQIHALTGRLLDANQRADHLLRRYRAEHAANPRARMPLRSLLFVRRHATPAAVRAARPWLRRSLLDGVLRALATLLVLVAATAAVTAYSSIREEWSEHRLREGHEAAARHAALTGDGRLITVGEDRQALVWALDRRRVLGSLPGHSAWITSVAVSPDGQWIATGCEDHQVRIWDRHLALSTTLQHQAPVVSVHFSADGRYLAAVENAPVTSWTTIWTVGDWQRHGELSLGFSHGTLVNVPGEPASVSHFGGSWDLETARRLAPPISGLAGNWTDWSTVRDLGAAVDTDGSVVFFDPRARKILERQPAHGDHGRAVAFSPDGRWLATGAEDIWLWSLPERTRSQRLEHSAVVWSLLFTPDGEFLVSTHADGAVLVWSLVERRLVADLGGHSRAVQSVAFRPDGRFLASAGDDGSIIEWDPETGGKHRVLLGHQGAINAVAYSPSGRRLISCSQSGELLVWETGESPTRRLELPPGHQPSCYGVAVDPTGQRLAAANRLWLDLAAEPLDLLGGTSEGSVYPLSFSPRQGWLAYGTDKGEVCLRRGKELDQVECGRTSDGGISDLEFTPDERQLVVGDNLGELWIWTTDPLRPLALLGRHRARVKAIAISPDGRQVASSGDDEVISLWNLEPRRLSSTIGSPASPVRALAFSPDGRRLASGEHDGTVRYHERRRTLWGRDLEP